jgi:hypothetical protein
MICEQLASAQAMDDQLQSAPNERKAMLRTILARSIAGVNIIVAMDPQATPILWPTTQASPEKGEK